MAIKQQTRSAPTGVEGEAERLVFVDALRVAVIVIVIAHHAAQPYGPTGGDWPVSDPGNSAWLQPFFVVNSTFGMGLMFLLAGYFVPRSYERNGAIAFLRGRWLRIGVPMVLFMTLIHGPVVYFFSDPTSFGAFVRDLYRSGWAPLYLHLWFLGHLLLYSASYVFWRRFRNGCPHSTFSDQAVPGHVAIVAFILGLAVVTWVVRWWYPIDVWMPLLFVVAAEPAHLPQYIALFASGVLAYRGNWLRRLPTATGLSWLGVGVVTAVGIYLVILLAPDSWDGIAALGGRSWQSLLYCTWEAAICAGMCVGLVVLFRTVFRRTSSLLAAMASASYAAYILHLLVVIGLQSAISGFGWPPLVKFGLVTLLGVPLSFGLGHFSRHVPRIRTMLGTG